MNEFQGKRAWVTGAARGIGRAVAQRLVDGGAQVVLVDADETAVRSAASELGAVGDAVDVTNGPAVQESIDHAADLLGGLDIVVNNAGIEIAKPLVEHTTEDVRRLLDVNVVGVFHGIKHGARHLEQTNGVIVNLASVAGLNGAPLLSAYCASKGAVMRLSEVAAIELKPRGIRVVSVCPAFVNTAMLDRLVPTFEAATGQRFDELAEGTQSRVGTVADIAEAVAFVVSDEAGWITGSSIVLDGGLTGSLV
jgi:NAD(P)-dependent dehydrogenase (short-subunit alcohol dehydrogenase family)